MLQSIVLPMYILAAIFMFSIIGQSYGSEKYGDCIVYKRGEIKPVITNGDRFCLPGRYPSFCKEFKCPKTACEQPLVSPYNKCPYCKGTCSYGGVVYQLESGFTCLDGHNHCTCELENSIGTTEKASNQQRMCLKKVRDLLVT